MYKYGINNLKIYNNTFEFNRSDTYGINLVTTLGGTSSNMDIENNVFWRTGSTYEYGASTDTLYEAESSANTIGGGAYADPCTVCSGGRQVKNVGSNNGSLQFNGVSAAAM